MYKEQINVVESHLLKRALHRPLDLIRFVQVIPHLCGHENILSLHGLVLLEEVANSVSNFGFVQVEPSAVQMSVTNFESTHNGLISLALGTFVGKSAEPNTRDFNAIIQCELHLVGHGDNQQFKQRCRESV